MSTSIDSNLANWSTTAASNRPAGTDTADLDADARQIQAVVRKYLRNKGADIASASTTDLANATGDYVVVTGTTTITALGTVAAGMRFVMEFSGALTLTHNGTSLKLPSAANITTAAGDVAIVESLGSGNWKCLVYQKYSGLAVVAPVYAATGANSDITSITGLTTPLTAAQGGTGLNSSSTEGNVLTSNGAIWVSSAPQTKQVQVRQTVLDGPVTTAGLPDFGGSTGGTTVTATGTLTVTAANGFGADGEVNRIGQITDPEWADLNVDGIMFLFLDIAADGTCTASSTSIYPIYQWGGTPAVDDGQFTFNIQEMTGYLGNGATAVQTYRVFVGEVNVLTNVLTITWYALMGRYQSANTSFTASSLTNFAHNLGVIPQIVNDYAVNTSTEGGYTAGQEIALPNSGGGGNQGFQVFNKDRNTRSIITGGTFYSLNTSSAQALLTIAKWALKTIVSRGW